MAQVIIDGSAQTAKAMDMARRLHKGENRPINDGAWIPRPTEYHVYIHSVSHRALKTEHALLGPVEIPALGKDERCITVRFIPHPVAQKVEDVFNTGRDPYDYHDGRRVAQDIVNPKNPTLVQDFKVTDPYYLTHDLDDTCNFQKYGVFWSLNQKPTEEEIERAEKIRDNFYRRTIQEHDKLYAAKPGNAASFGPDVRMALDYFGEQREYHKKFVPVQMCDNCGSQIPLNAGFHFLPNGVACIRDWKKAVDSGVKTKDDVPEDKRWWKAKA